MLCLRASEWINTLAFSWFLVLAWCLRGLGWVRRMKITAIGAAGLTITLFMSRMLPYWVAPFPATVSRDWIPYLLLLMFYWQSGQFVMHTDVALETRLSRLDRRLVAPLLQWCAPRTAGAWMLTYLELAYLSCYVALPFGLAAVYLLGHRRDTDFLWTVVLPATYACYAILPFIQTRPPRVLGEKWTGPAASRRVRRLNLWILRHGSIHANTIPSAHVASATACALVLLHLGPLWVGLAFLLIAISIALGAVAGRYHYAVDVILGAVVASLVFLAAITLQAYFVVGLGGF